MITRKQMRRINGPHKNTENKKIKEQKNNEDKKMHTTQNT